MTPCLRGLRNWAAIISLAQHRLLIGKLCFMATHGVHRFTGRTFGYLLAAAIAGAPLISRPWVRTQTPMETARGSSALSRGAAEFGDGSSGDSWERTGGAVAGAGDSRVGPVDVAPVGWRKTNRGWERAEDWGHVVANTNTERLSQIVAQQELAEASAAPGRWLHGAFAVLRRVDPITLVSLQICLLALLVAMVYDREAKQARQQS